MALQPDSNMMIPPIPARFALAFTLAMLASPSVSGEGFYFRQPSSQGTNTSAPAPTPTANSTVPGTGDFTVMGPPYARAAPDAPLIVQLRSDDASRLRWVSVGQALPPGVTLTTYGLIKGTPSAPGTYPGIIAEATDAEGRTARTSPFTLAVGTPVVSLDPVRTSYRVRVGQALAIQASATSLAGTAEWSLPVATGQLPSGIGFDPDNARLIGDIAGTGAATFHFSVKDNSDGVQARSATLSLDAAPALGLSGVAGSYGAHLGSTFSTGTPVPTGFRASPAYALDMAVPPGMSFVDGVLSGSPGAAIPARTVTLTATDPWDGLSARATFTIEAAGPLAFATQPKDVAGLFGTYLSTAPAVSNAVRGASFALLRNSSPSPSAIAGCTGLSLDTSTGRIYGTPTAACDVTGLALRVTDGSGAGLTSNAFSVSAKPAVTPGTASYVATSTFTVPNYNTISLQVAGTKAADVENSYWAIRKCNVGSVQPGANGGTGTSNVLTRGAAESPVPGTTVTVTKDSPISWTLRYVGTDGKSYNMYSGYAHQGYPWDGDSTRCTLFGAASTPGTATGNVPGTYTRGTSSVGGVGFTWN